MPAKTQTREVVTRLKLTRLIMACLFITLAGLFFPNTAHAESKVYALGCVGKDNHVKINDSKFSCTRAPSVVTLQGIGTAQEANSNNNPYPDDIELTLVVVDCGKSKPADPSLASEVKKFKCDKGSAKVRKQNVSPNPIPPSNNPTIPSSGTGTYGGNGPGSSSAECDTAVNARCSICTSKDATDKSCARCNGQACIDSAGDPTTVCNQDNGCDLIAKYVNPFINFFSVVFGLIAVISIIFAGMQYSASQGDPQKITASKKRLVNTIIAIVSYFFLYGFLQFLVPGGIFNR